MCPEAPRRRSRAPRGLRSRNQGTNHTSLDAHRHNAQRGTAFSPEQTEWLRLMKDHIASSCSISREDFDYAELADKGGLQKVWGLFGNELDTLMKEMNEELVV